MGASSSLEIHFSASPVAAGSGKACVPGKGGVWI